MGIFGHNHKHEMTDREIIGSLLESNLALMGVVTDLLDRIPKIPPNDNMITSLRVTKISINNLNIQGNIMSVQFGKAQKATATVTGFNAALQAVGLGHLSGLTATIDNTAVATVGTVDAVNQTVDILGVSDGNYNITYSGTNDAGTLVSFTDQGVISDETPPADNLITSLGATYSAPVAQ